jgi:N4-gp56 family major capsid protein
VLSIFYDRVFLDRAKLMLSYDFGAQKKTIPANSGTTVRWNRFTPLAVATTALTDGSTSPSAVDMTTTQVSAVLAHYGNFTPVSDLFNLTSLDVNLKEHSEVHGQNAGETLDTLIRNELGGTSSISIGSATTTFAAGGATTTGGILSTHVLDGASIRKAVRVLKVNKAQRFEDGFYRGVIDVNQAYDLFGNTEWLNSISIYTNPEQLQKGIVGKLHGVQFVETNNGLSWSNAGGGFSPAVTIYSCYVFGKNAYGTVSLEGQGGPRIIVKTPGPSDTSNPLDIFSTVGWKALFAVKVLNATWIVRIFSAATA